jgi:vitamin K-dependent gamma-carboxylase
MIPAFAHELARRERRAGRDVAVYADVFAVLNGRPPRRLIDPNVDLARESDGLTPKAWILPGP